ncbi:hypothetical protein DV515_00007637 [Chloebia gouldiae]|uniref:Uncharacterized protein n=1 Tax=Chloebia gouldiae TaxID=44316 RepID=A0A3L8SGR9_CHLGU|nr:hypothetical protein DV515_00007637 [Chloebia gouldiae]
MTFSVVLLNNYLVKCSHEDEGVGRAGTAFVSRVNTDAWSSRFCINRHLCLHLQSC